ncbi:hypothetical protein BGY98DRAFT_73891 [Russula aff. rugulosa BPL654]|nr:hypothetical protein BGY98DRAFT_73891 [Russula aff. rugulosa BPL654]
MRCWRIPYRSFSLMLAFSDSQILSLCLIHNYGSFLHVRTWKGMVQVPIQHTCFFLPRPDVYLSPVKTLLRIEISITLNPRAKVLHCVRLGDNRFARRNTGEP